MLNIPPFNLLFFYNSTNRSVKFSEKKEIFVLGFRKWVDLRIENYKLRSPDRTTLISTKVKDKIEKRYTGW